MISPTEKPAQKNHRIQSDQDENGIRIVSRHADRTDDQNRDHGVRRHPDKDDEQNHDHSVTRHMGMNRILIILFLCTAALLIVFPVRSLLHRRSAVKAVRTAIEQLSVFDPNALPAEEASALRHYLDDLSVKVHHIEQDGDSASASVSICGTNAEALARDIRRIRTEESMRNALFPGQAAEPTDSFVLMNRLLQEQQYDHIEKEGQIHLTNENSKWIVRQDPALRSFLLGGLPEYLEDPDLLSPEEITSIYLNLFRKLTTEEWASYLGCKDIFATYASSSDEIDAAYLKKIAECYDFSIDHVLTAEDSAEVHADITSIDMHQVFQNYRDKLIAYALTVDSVKDDSAALSARNAQALTEAIMETSNTAIFPVTIHLKRDDSAWNITDTPGLTDAQMGGMSDAVRIFSEEAAE